MVSREMDWWWIGTIVVIWAALAVALVALWYGGGQGRD
jgi:F0F1-type ATP synthase membrane subunit c/vacuolar-type H+-ATPase subunit K